MEPDRLSMMVSSPSKESLMIKETLSSHRFSYADGTGGDRRDYRRVGDCGVGGTQLPSRSFSAPTT